MRLLGGGLARCGAGLLLGVLIGVAAVAVHPWWWGLLIGVTASSATLLVLARGALRISYAAAWAIVMALAATPRPTGGYAIAGNLEGYVLILLAVAMVIVATATFQRSSPAEDSGHRGA